VQGCHQDHAVDCIAILHIDILSYHYFSITNWMVGAYFWILTLYFHQFRS
jgi:hypothetical protein